MKILSIVVLAALAQTALSAASATHQARPKGSTAAPYGYLEYLPAAYHSEPQRRFPVVIFLHGLGETGDGRDSARLWRGVSQHGPHKLVQQGEQRFDREGVLLLSPQSPGWWSTGSIDQFVSYVLEAYRIDPGRVYLTGLSMGGGGVWNYVKEHGERVAACIPICGASGGGDGTRFRDTPTWAFHAWDDGAVTRRDSINWCNDVAGKLWSTGKTDLLRSYPHRDGDPGKAASGDMTGAFSPGSDWIWHAGVVAVPRTHPKLTLYTSGGHDSWSRTYANPRVWDWLLAQRKTVASPPPPPPPNPPPPPAPPKPPQVPVIDGLRVTLRGSVSPDVQRVRHGQTEVAVRDGRFTLVLALPAGSVETRIQLVAADGQTRDKTVRLERSELGGG